MDGVVVSEEDLSGSECDDALPNCGCDLAEVSCRANGPGAECRVVVREESLVKRRFERTAANERPQRLQTCRSIRGGGGNEALLRLNLAGGVYGSIFRPPLTRPRGHPLPIRWGEGRAPSVGGYELFEF